MASVLKPPVNEKDHIQGNMDAPLELVEFGDYECPHCGRAYPIIKAIQKKMGRKLKFVFRNFPMAEAHPHAFAAAIASEAADRQGKYWPMHDMLFENQHNLTGAAIRIYAISLGLDEEVFLQDMGDVELRAKVEADFESGIRSGVNGTPTFFVNGIRYNGSWEPSIFLEYLNEQLTISNRR
jgi:protein-disulfide isomerase